MPPLMDSKEGKSLGSLGGLAHPYHLLERLLHELVEEEIDRKDLHTSSFKHDEELYIIFQDKESIDSLCQSKLGILFLSSILSRGGHGYTR